MTTKLKTVGKQILQRIKEERYIMLPSGRYFWAGDLKLDKQTVYRFLNVLQTAGIVDEFGEINWQKMKALFKEYEL